MVYTRFTLVLLIKSVSHTAIAFLAATVMLGVPYRQVQSNLRVKGTPERDLFPSYTSYKLFKCTCIVFFSLKQAVYGDKNTLFLAHLSFCSG